MSPPRRLLDGPPGSLERDLLQLWQNDVPPEHGKTSVVRALVSTGYLLPSAPLATGLGSGPAAPIAAAGKSAVVKPLLASLGWAKWFVGGSLVGAVAVSQMPTSSTPTAQTQTMTTVLTTSPVRQPAIGPAEVRAPDDIRPGEIGAGEETHRAPNSDPSLAPAAGPSSQLAPGPRFRRGPFVQPEAPAAPTGAETPLPLQQDAPEGPAPSASASRGASLSAQIALLDRARAASENGRHLEALQLLDVYERRFAREVMEQEALLLKVEVLLKQGERAAAESTARRLLDAYPKSSHVRRLKSLLSPPGGRDQKNDSVPIEGRRH
jgi:hypothetical protein